MSDSRAIADVFDRSAPSYDSVIPFFTTFGELLVDVAAVASGERVLDVAAGRGASAFPAAARGAEVVAVDLAPVMVERLRADAAERGLDHVTVETGDAEELAYEDEFDVVLCGFALHIVPAPDRAFEGFLRALRPGGRCAVSFPTGGGPGWEFYGDVLRRFAPRARPPLTPPPAARDLPELMAAAGFAGVEERDETRTFTFDGPDAWWAWVWSHGQRAPLEHFDEATLEEIRAEMFEAVAGIATPDGIALHQSARFITGVKPAS